MTTNKTIEDLRVTIKPKHPFAYGDTLTFNLPPETIAEIAQLMLQERISELKNLKKHNGGVIGIDGKRIDNMVNHSVINDRIERLQQNDRRHNHP